jgi:peptide/nickel transport system substrate-binding protein
MPIFTPAARSRLPTIRIQSSPNADQDKRNEDYCAISRLVNKEAIWFWTFQNTYYAMSSTKVKGLPKMYSGVVDLSRVWLE